MTMTATATIAEAPFSDLLESLPPDFDDLRRDAREAFLRMGLPNIKTEAWKFTSLNALLAQPFDRPGESKPFPVDELPTVTTEHTHRLVVVNGRFRPDLSVIGDLPSSVRLSGFGALEKVGAVAAVEGYPFVALNSALFRDGVTIEVPAGITIPEAVEVVFVTVAEDKPTAVFPRLLLIAGDNSQVTLVEHHVGFGAGVTLSVGVSEVIVGQGAQVQHYTVQREQPQALHIGHTAVELAKDAHCDSFVLQAGARLSRREVKALLAEPGIDYRISGAYMVKDVQHSDISTFIDHAAANCKSREVIKGVIDGRARGVFQGKILVRPDSQKTDGYQINRALLLSDHAEVDSKPELEIYADDVKCSHGATAGELEDEALFYLRSRGIDLGTARALLTAAFLGEVTEEIQDDTVRAHVQAVVDHWLEARAV